MVNRALTLILGGARSGKSDHAERRALERGGEDVLFVATAEALDEEMAARIQAHREQRPATWRTLEAPRGLGRRLNEIGATPRVALIDCLTLLASNLLMTVEREGRSLLEAEPRLTAELDALLAWHGSTDAELIVVSNEVGLGLVPPTELGRVYRDLLGRANARLAAVADTVLLLVAGIPVVVKGS